MDYELRVVVEKVSVASQEVVKRDTLKIYDINEPQSILDLGLRHEEQISLLSKVQNSLLSEQSILINPGHEACPNCGQKVSKNGFLQSKFHAVFSDHKLRIQRHCCKKRECNWQTTPTTISVFGTNIHPDLAKLQCEQGALHSYREAQANLEKLTVHRRPVNNHNQIKQITNQVGAVLSKQNLQPIARKDRPTKVKEIIVQIDGGHLPIQEKNKRSFEALCTVAYRPENIEQIDKHHRRIKDKSCVMSAVADDLATMKVYALNAAHKQGMTKRTTVTVLADGASNCWSVAASLVPHCKKLEPILDWFHIAKKFQNVKGALGETFEKALERAKWTVWHGDAEGALSKLALLKDNLTDERKLSKLNGLYKYIKGNEDYIVDYGQRQTENKTFTSQVAESHIESMINARHKASGKMQWTRDSAHNVLQIRAIIKFEEWNNRWQEAVISALVPAA